MTDASGLAELATAIGTAEDCAISFVCDGDVVVRSDLVGLAIALPDGQSFYVPVGQRSLGSAATLREKDVFAALKEVLAAKGVRKQLYDAKSLDVFLRVRGAKLGGVANDVMLAAYVLDSASADYELPVLADSEQLAGVLPRTAWLGSGRNAHLAADVSNEEAAKHLCAEARAILQLSRRQSEELSASGQELLYRDVELALSPVLAAMEWRGIRLDCDYLRVLGNDVARGTQVLEAEIHALAGSTFNIASPKQLAEVLFVKLGLPVIRKTKTGASTDAEVLEELAAMHPVPAKILDTARSPS